MMALVGATLGGCWEASTTTCSDGTTCPEATVCAPASGGCASPEQITACDGLDEGVSCTAKGVDDGVCLSHVCTSTVWSADVVVGGRLEATKVALVNPTAAAFGPDGSVYIAVEHVIQRVDASGELTTIAGTGDGGYGGDGGDATSAQLNGPRGIAVDGLGQVFIADTGNHRIRRVDAAGIITTVAGIGSGGFTGDNGPATEASLNFPQGIGVDGRGNLTIADTYNQRVRCVDTNGLIATCAGKDGFGFSGDGGPATAALLSSPTSVVTDNNGNLFIADSMNHRVRKVNSRGVISTVAGVSEMGFNGDGPTATVRLSFPTGLALEGAALLIADRDNHRVRRVANGTVTTVAGGGAAGFGGDGGPATAALLSAPQSVAVDRAGSFIAVEFQGMRVRRVDRAGAITTIAGNGTTVATSGLGASTSTHYVFSRGVAANPRGGFTFSHIGSVIYDVDGKGRISASAGTAPGFAGDGGPAKDAAFLAPTGLAYDRAGNLYISDLSNRRVRRIDPKGIVTTVAGNGTNGSAGDGGPATSAQLGGAYDVAVDRAGNLYIADTGNARIRRVDTRGIITTVAGSTPGFGGDGGDATLAKLDTPLSIAVDSDGALFIADTGNARIRRVVDGKISTVAGGGAEQDGSNATSARLTYPAGLALDGDHGVYLADPGDPRIRRVHGGLITTVAGSGAFGDDGDGGLALSATIAGAWDVAIDRGGQLYIAETNRQRIRRVDPSGIITTVAGAIDPGTMGARSVARLANPRAIAAGPEMTLFAGGTSGTLQALIGDAVSVVGGRYPQETATGELARFRDSRFGAVGGVAYDPVTGQIFITETTAHRIQAITVVDPADPTTWTISAFANRAGVAGVANGAAGRARFRNPTGLFLDDAARRLYVADTGNHVVRVIDLSQGLDKARVSTLAGTPSSAGFAGDDGAAGASLLSSPSAVTRCANGDVFIADTGNHRVRRIARGGTITTVLGDGTASSSGEGAPAKIFPVAAPRGLGCGAVGNLFVTSTTTVRMLVAHANGVVDGDSAVRTIYGLPPRDAFPLSATRCLSGLAVTNPVTDTGTVRVTDSCTGVVIELRRQLHP